MEERSFAELIEDMNEVLAEFDGDALAEIAESVLGKKVEYTEDSIFKVG